jgi:PIN domain nuclease of toxin-antitoxin system
MDSTALIAVVYQEPGYERVVEILDKSAISAVNLAEIINKLVLRGSPAEAVRHALLKLELTVEDWTDDLAYRSAEFTPFTKSHGLSLGGRACLTLAKHLHATAVTSDRTWRRTPSLGVPIMIFR